MKEEMEEGHFDSEGMYHWNKEGNVRDNWLENIDWIKVSFSKHFKPYELCKIMCCRKNLILILQGMVRYLADFCQYGFTFRKLTLNSNFRSNQTMKISPKKLNQKTKKMHHSTK